MQFENFLRSQILDAHNASFLYVLEELSQSVCKNSYFIVILHYIKRKMNVRNLPIPIKTQ